MKLRIAGVSNDSIVDGEGIRYTVFVQGCKRDCPGCHNPESHDFNGGRDMTTKEIFEAMKDAGFDSVRIPVAWTSTMDWRNGDFEINKDYLERVATVVQYALDADFS